MAPKAPKSSRRLSLSGGLNSKLRCDGNMEESEILELLREAKEAPQYTILTFDKVTFDATITAAIVELLQTTSRYGRDWERLNLKFCEGPVDDLSDDELATI